jgi:hypothetical protein
MMTFKQLKINAIAAAKCGNWDEAISVNDQLLEIEPHNVNTLNRMGVAYAQSDQSKKATAIFSQVLEIDKHNLIAKKHLAKLKNNHCLTAPTFVNQHFIEEPGKTKVVELHRLAGKNVLLSLSVGAPCDLVRKKRFISVEVGDQYIGALPEDLSFRLCKLISLGNSYHCLIRSATENTCCVYIQEVKKSKRNANIHSFPPGKYVAKLSDHIDETILIDDTPSPTPIKTDSDKPEEEKLDPNVMAMP